jgi:hypothetical protein
MSFALKDCHGEAEGIRFRGGVSQRVLIHELDTGRVRQKRVLIVTLGKGSHSECARDHGTGFIARDKGEFIRRTAELLSDNGLWLARNRACLADAELTSAPAFHFARKMVEVVRHGSNAVKSFLKAAASKIRSPRIGDR